MNRLFVTGTDTGVGKSIVTAALAASAVGRVAALKPVASGVEPGSCGQDADLLGRAAGHSPRVRVALPLPVSPHRAAAEADQALSLDDLVPWIEEHKADEVFVEGVGGWTVPLSWTVSVADLAESLASPVLVVAADRLGVLNHTLLTVQAVRSRGLPLVGVVLNTVGPEREEDHHACRFNLADLRELLPGVTVTRFPCLEDLEVATLATAGRSLREALGM